MGGVSVVVVLIVSLAGGRMMVVIAVRCVFNCRASADGWARMMGVGGRAVCVAVRVSGRRKTLTAGWDGPGAVCDVGMLA